jgi:hypothetical protein
LIVLIYGTNMNLTLPPHFGYVKPAILIFRKFLPILLINPCLIWFRLIRRFRRLTSQDDTGVLLEWCHSCRVGLQ